jgi:hypothetical protein
MEMTMREALRIIKTELILDSKGVYRAIDKETNSKKCYMNRMRRLNAINKFIGNETDKFPYLNWLPLAQEENDDDDQVLCICGHPITTSHVLIYKPKTDIQIAHGSECIKRVRTEFVDYPEAEEFVESFNKDHAKLKRTCFICKGKKLVKNKFCGGEECELTIAKRKQEQAEKLRAEQEAAKPKPKSRGHFFHFNMSRECLV